MSNLAPELAHTIHDIAISPSYVTDGTAYAASQAGLFKSVDYCQSWEVIGEPIPITKLLMTPDLLIACCVGSIARSVTKGNTWTNHSLPIPTSLVSALIEHEDCLLLGTLDDGVLRSDDKGEKWRGWNFGLLDWHILSLAVTAQGIVYAGTETGLFKSRNGGKSWQVTAPDIQSPILALAAYDNDMLVATEAGQLLRVSPDDDSVSPLFESENAINALAVSPIQQVAILDDTTIRLSHDGGQTWAQTITQVDDALTLGWITKRLLIVGCMDGVIVKVGIES